MKFIQMLVVTMLCAACSSTPPIAPGQTYLSPIGTFDCRTDRHFQTQAKETFGPHGGTVHLITPVDMIRIDVEEFSPQLQGKKLLPLELHDLYANYLQTSLMPLIRHGAPDAKQLSQKDEEIGGRKVYFAAILFPGKSNFMYPSGKYADGIRAQIQYTTGRFMYTVSKTDYVRPERTVDAQLQQIHADVIKAFSSCRFPD
jgi:hypothetical protein